MRALALLLALLPLPALAECQNESEVFSCRIGAKTLQVCHWKGMLIYQYGRPEAWDLSLAEPLETAAFTPWPGFSSNIWETVAFPNKGYTYEVWTSVTRDPDSTQPLQGGVNVLQGEDLKAQLTCDNGTASNSLDVIFDLKESIGQCWDFDSRSWQTACD